MQIYLQEPVRNLTALYLTDPATYAVYWLIVILKLYYTPFIVTAGIVGNVTCFLTLRSKTFKQISAVPYISALSIFDIVFLTSLFAVWLSHFGLDLYNSDCWCEVLTYSNYICGFLSVWLTFCLVVDRVITVYSLPTRVKRVCTPLKAKLTIFAFVVVAIAVFLNVSLLYGLIHTQVGSFCMRLPQFALALDVLLKMDMAINFLLPYTAMSVLVMVTLVRMRKLYIWRKTIIQVTEGNVDSVSGQCVRLPKRQKEMCLPSCILCLSLLVLNYPSHMLRLTTTLTESFTERRFLWQQLCVFFMFTRAALNFPILVFSSRSFRKALWTPMIRLLPRPNAKNRNVHRTLVEFPLSALSPTSPITKV